jgi:ABC-type oligopeptide transport system substrate-binding subunit
MSVKSRLACAVVAGASLALTAFALPAQANLLVNGSFESGNFTGWAQSGNTGATTVVGPGFDGFNPEDGNFQAALGPVGSDGHLSQTFSDTLGQSLLVSFWFASDGGTPNDFSATFDGGTLISGSNWASSSPPYTHYTFVLLGNGSDTIEFSFRNDPSYLFLDNVSVTELTATPLPSTWTMLIAGFLGLGYFAYRGTKKASAFAAVA